MTQMNEESIYCAECDKQLTTVYSDGTYKLHHDQGICPICGYLYCSNCLNIPVGVFRNSWAVAYRGYKCNKCYEKGGAKNGR